MTRFVLVYFLWLSILDVCLVIICLTLLDLLIWQDSNGSCLVYSTAFVCFHCQFSYPYVVFQERQGFLHELPTSVPNPAAEVLWPDEPECNAEVIIIFFN